MAKTTPNVKGIEGGQILVHEESSVYCRESGAVTTIALGGTVPAGTDLIGQPVSGSAGAFTLIAGTDEASATGIIVGGPPIPVDTAQNTALPDEYAVLVRGPAAINPDAIPATDSVGAALDGAAVGAALAALGVPIISLAITPDETVQTT